MGKRPGNIFSRQRKAPKEGVNNGNNNKVGDKIVTSVCAVSIAGTTTTADHGPVFDDVNDRLIKTNMKKSRQKSENTRSLRKMKKRGGVVRQMLEKFPKPNKPSAAPRVIEEMEGPYDIIAARRQEDVELESRKDQPSSSSKANLMDQEEPIYESRKLLIRQMQGMIAKEVQKDRKGTVGSEYDSWSDLEENFARAYEPIPLNIHMDTWRRMSKKDILRTVKSRTMRKEFEYMSRSEILGHIEKMQQSAKYLSNKFGVDHLLEHNHPPLTKKQLERAQKKGRDVDIESIVTDFSNDIPPYVSRSEILQAYEAESRMNEDESSQQKQQKQQQRPQNGQHGHKSQKAPRVHDSWSSRASSILKNPASIYVSREEVLKNLKEDILRAAPPPPGPPPPGVHASNNKRNAAPKIHDSWSSRASSIMAKGMSEPNYMSRSEMLTKLAELSHAAGVGNITTAADIEAITAMIHEEDESFSSESSSEASTVKNVVLKSRATVQSAQWHHHQMSEKEDSERELRGDMAEKKEANRKMVTTDEARVEPHTHDGEDGEEIYTSSDGSCSCESCISYTSCSCCDHEDEEEAMLSSMTTNASVETIVDRSDRDKRNHRDMYIVNGSDIIPEEQSISARNNNNNSNKNYDPIPKSTTKVVKQKQLITERRDPDSRNSTPSTLLDQPPIQRSRAKKPPKFDETKSWSNGEFEQMYEPVNVSEIRRQKNATALKKYLREFAADWDGRVNDLNTFRRGRVLKELKKHLRETIDLDNVKPEDLSRKVQVALREALDSSFEALSNVNIGHMYVPMEENPSNSKAVSRENTDYDTFGSIDSLIFEPKIPSNEDIEEAQEEIEQQFDYLKQFDDQSGSILPPDDITGPGKTTFAERVKLFQRLGNKIGKERPPSPVQPPTKKITFLDVIGQETSWKQVALAKRADKKNNQEHRNDDDEQLSLCPECNNVMMESLVCSTCDCCTQCDEEEKKDAVAASDLQHISSGTASWDFVDGDEKPTRQKPGDESNLRRRLKETFGVMADILTAPDSANKIQPLYEPLIYSSSDMEHNLEYDVDFLSEYAQKTSLFPVEVTAAQVLDKSGKIIPISEDVFRGDLEGTLRRMGMMDDRRGIKKGASPELNASDSGIASPPCGDGSSILTGSHHHVCQATPMGGQLIIYEATEREETNDDDEEEEEDEPGEDSGLDGEAAERKPDIKKLVVPSAKRDTMIRELKNKLKKKFQVEGELEDRSSPDFDDEDVAGDPIIGTVESRKLVMAPQLAKMFAARSATQMSSSASSSFVSKKKTTSKSSCAIEAPKVMTTFASSMTSSNKSISRQHLGKIREVTTPLGSSHYPGNCSDCGEPLTPSPPPPPPTSSMSHNSRELLYGPGGLFGPKGPFSTPNVRYPHGLEVPPKNKATSRTSVRNKTPTPHSELTSVAEDRSVKSHYVMNSVLSMTPRPMSSAQQHNGRSSPRDSKPSSRMETYRAEWSELPQEDIDRWREEKAKRMLAWIHTSQGSEQIGTETPWWKVRSRPIVYARVGR
jgi:hypothetical protein